MGDEGDFPDLAKKAVSPPGGGQASTHLASERKSMSGSREIAEQRSVVRTHCTAAGCNQGLRFGAGTLLEHLF